MKGRQVSLGIIALAITLTGLFSSCKKKDVEVKDSDTSSVMVQEYTSDMVHQMICIADEVGRPQLNRQDDLSSCARISYDTLSAAKTVTVDFNYNQSCQASDGKQRRGFLIIGFQGRYRDSLTKITITSRNYNVDDKYITGSKIITNKGHNTAGHLIYDIEGYIRISIATSAFITHESKEQREWIAGGNTQSRGDDVFAFTGIANGTSDYSGNYNTVITSPLIRKMTPGCLKPTSGSVTFTPTGKGIRYIDYGDGNCDDLAIATIDNEPYIVFLR